LSLAYAVIDSVPQTLFVKPLDASAAQESKNLALKLRQTINHKTANKMITVTASELSGLLSLMHRAIPQLVGNAVLIENEAYVDISVALPLLNNNFPSYINVSASIFSTQQGINIGDITVGDIHVSGQILLNFLVWLVDSYTGKDNAQKMVDSIQRININANRINVNAYWEHSDMELAKDNGLLAAIRDHLALFGDVNSVQRYLDTMVLYARSHKAQIAQDTLASSQNNNSLAPFINKLFQQVKRNHSGQKTSIALENKAALAALVLYFGDDRFALAVGPLSELSAQDKHIREQLKRTVTLQHRVDLQKHFVYSIALQLFSSHYASDALGEFKELLDTNKGGSGFSFADLQADRAGTRLALVATHSDTSALMASDILVNIEEAALLPSIKGLEEGLDELQFNQKYLHVDSPKYQEYLNIIDGRLALLPIYQVEGVLLF